MARLVGCATGLPINRLLSCCFNRASQPGGGPSRSATDADADQVGLGHSALTTIADPAGTSQAISELAGYIGAGSCAYLQEAGAIRCT